MTWIILDVFVVVAGGFFCLRYLRAMRRLDVQRAWTRPVFLACIAMGLVVVIAVPIIWSIRHP